MIKKKIISSILALTIIIFTTPFVYADEVPADTGQDSSNQTESVQGGNEEAQTVSEPSPASENTAPESDASENVESAPCDTSEPASETEVPVITEEQVMEEYLGQPGLSSDEPSTDEQVQVGPAVDPIIDFIPPAEEPVGEIQDGVLEEAILPLEDAAPTSSGIEITSEGATTVSEPAIEVPEPVYQVLYDSSENRVYSSTADFILENNTGHDSTYSISLIENLGSSPYVVPYSKYTEREWRNLTTSETLNNMAIGIEVDGNQYWYDGHSAEILYMEAGSTANITILFQHGNSWTVNYELSYRIVLDISLDNGPEMIEVVGKITSPADIAGTNDLQTPEEPESQEAVDQEAPVSEPILLEEKVSIDPIPEPATETQAQSDPPTPVNESPVMEADPSPPAE